MAHSVDEGPKRCPLDSKPAARVDDAEELALIVCHPFLCDQHGRPNEGAFEFHQLLMTNKNLPQYPHDCCGHSEGISLRRTEKSEAAVLMETSLEVSKRKSADELPMGAAIAIAEDLRGLRLDSSVKSNRPDSKEISASEQIVFVLADGGHNNPKHAVLRLHQEADRSIAKQLRKKLMDVFLPYQDWLSRLPQP